MNASNSSPKIRFVIFGQGRTGSTLLVDLLNSHPDIHCDGEILNTPWRGWQRRYLLPRLKRHPLPYFYLKAALCRQPAYGFNLIINHCADPKQVLTEMEHRGWRILHIQRRDVFNQAVSFAVAGATKLWHRRNGQTPETTRITIHPELEGQDAQEPTVQVGVNDAP